MIKKLLSSRTVQLALIQAVFGVALVVATELEQFGAIVIIKSIMDILLRIDTAEPIK